MMLNISKIVVIGLFFSDLAVKKHFILIADVFTGIYLLLVVCIYLLDISMKVLNLLMLLTSFMN